MLVQLGLCQTCLETTLLFFSHDVAQNIYGLLVAPGKAYADWFSRVVIFEALFVCHPNFV